MLKKADINISELNSSDYENMDLVGLEKSLDEIQKNIADIGSINLASPEEYLERQNDLSSLIQQGESRKLELQKIIANTIKFQLIQFSLLIVLRFQRLN